MLERATDDFKAIWPGAARILIACRPAITNRRGALVSTRLWTIVFNRAHGEKVSDMTSTGDQSQRHLKTAHGLLAACGHMERSTQWGKTSHVPLYGWCHIAAVFDGNAEYDLWEPVEWRPPLLSESEDG